MLTDGTRRKFLEQILRTGGAALAQQSNLLSSVGRHSTTLGRPRFYWGVGIENCWMAQTNPSKDGNRRLLDVFLQMQHYERWKADLDLAKGIGFNAIRYSVPW